jgi:uncharacterized protein YabE (DUF348 family)
MVSLYADGQEKVFSSEAKSVGDVLRKSGVKLGVNDLVEPSAGTAISGSHFNVNVYRSRPVLVVDGAKSYHIRSAYQSPRLLALAAGLSVYAEDKYRSEVITDIVQSDTIGERVTLQRATPVTVKVDGKTRQIRTQGKVLGEAIKNADIAIGPKDTISKPLAAPVVPGMTVAITRVSEAVITQTQTLPRSVKTVPDGNLYRGQSQVKVPGSDGQKTITYKVHYLDGVETSRQQLQVLSETAPVTKVVNFGTKIPDDGWAKLRQCEAGGNYAMNSGNGYYGAYQFDVSTWQSNGGVGLPSDASPATQDAIAKSVFARRGSQPWPICGRYLN